MIDMNLPVMFYLHCIDLLLLVHSAIKDLGLGLEACGLGIGCCWTGLDTSLALSLQRITVGL